MLQCFKSVFYHVITRSLQCSQDRPAHSLKQIWRASWEGTAHDISRRRPKLHKARSVTEIISTTVKYSIYTKKNNVIITITILRIPYGWFHKFNALTKPFPVPGQQRTRVYWKWKKWKCGKKLKILFQLLNTKCSYLDTGTGNVLSMRQKDTCSTCELNCVLHSFSEQTQFSKGTYLQKTRRQIRKSIMKAKHLNTNTGETTNSDLQYFAFDSVLYVSAHSPNKM